MKFYSKKNIKISIRSVSDVSIGTVDEETVLVADLWIKESNLNKTMW